MEFHCVLKGNFVNLTVVVTNLMKKVAVVANCMSGDSAVIGANFSKYLVTGRPFMRLARDTSLIELFLSSSEMATLSMLEVSLSEN